MDRNVLRNLIIKGHRYEQPFTPEECDQADQILGDLVMDNLPLHLPQLVAIQNLLQQMQQQMQQQGQQVQQLQQQMQQQGQQLQQLQQVQQQMQQQGQQLQQQVQQVQQQVQQLPQVQLQGSIDALRIDLLNEGKRRRNENRPVDSVIEWLEPIPQAAPAVTPLTLQVLVQGPLLQQYLEHYGLNVPEEALRLGELCRFLGLLQKY